MMKNQELTTKNQEASMKNMERQIRQLSKQIVIERPSSSLPSDTIPNPKEECKTIQLRSEKTLVANKEATKRAMGSNKESTEKKEANKDMTTCKQAQEMEEPTKDHRQGVNFTPPLPYPQRFNKDTKDQHFPKFLELFKKLEINIPLAEALEQMPLYAKFLKELINKKRSWQEKKTVLLIEEYRALIQKGLPPKLEDPGSFLLPCTIGSMIINKAMCDLLASINLMPYSLVRKLCIEEVKPIQISLELVDKSVICPRGVIENLLVKVDKFIFPTDDMSPYSDEDEGDSIILGRPFLATARAIIDVEQGELTLRMHDESITLNVFPKTQLIDEKKNRMEIDKEGLQWKEGINKTTSNYLPK
ncbi:uncharacterized protein LOC107484213 [Arachis duranensis]|uniref:Uncharacterized protein LOC107484213 n=1 Tax=Arachis duranensis TaxID=130453 RepID=A0A6P4D2I5_ARADU|nr:uncharacterized protein LOC107484213 [Arachis duranensis]